MQVVEELLRGQRTTELARPEKSTMMSEAAVGSFQRRWHWY